MGPVIAESASGRKFVNGAGRVVENALPNHVAKLLVDQDVLMASLELQISGVKETVDR